MMYSVSVLSSLVLSFTLVPVFAAATDTTNSSSCRRLPGDNHWPSEAKWSALNKTVEGKLIATIPLGSPCHDPNYNASACSALQASWVFPQAHFDSSSSIVAPYFQNQSCDPFTPESSACLIGNYVDYAIRAETADDVAAGLVFAQNHNVRLVVKNTGHDLLGRSTGKGGLSIWTHYLKSITISDYKSTAYTGKAMKMGAGVQAWEAYEAAGAAGLQVVGGTCPTVGLAGGYTQGGGHSMLSTAYGLGADQALEWEVVLANGTHVVATPESNSDLYWALSGGGGGTYAVVLSLTVKAHEDFPVTGVALNIIQTTDADAFWKAISAFHDALPSWTDNGGAAGYFLINGFLALEPGTFPNRTSDEVTVIIQPLVDQLKQLNIQYTVNITTFPGYLPFFQNYFGPLPFGTFTSAQVQGGRLVPRSIVASPTSNNALTGALRTITSNLAFHVVGVALNVTDKATSPNAVLPGWRDAVTTLVVAANWDYQQAFSTNAVNETLITDSFDPLLTSVTGTGSGAYLNEGDFQQPDFQTQFFGSNYAKLLEIKNKYDPFNLFYGTALVGSDAWVVASDGRLCRA